MTLAQLLQNHFPAIAVDEESITCDDRRLDLTGVFHGFQKDLRLFRVLIFQKFAEKFLRLVITLIKWSLASELSPGPASGNVP